MSLSTIRREWLRRPMREMLAGAVATFALIPEVIAFSFAAGVDPQVGLFASFVIGIVIAFAGGRPAMISAAAGSVALVAAPLVEADREDGIADEGHKAERGPSNTNLPTGGGC